MAKHVMSEVTVIGFGYPEARNLLTLLGAGIGPATLVALGATARDIVEPPDRTVAEVFAVAGDQLATDPNALAGLIEQLVGSSRVIVLGSAQASRDLAGALAVRRDAAPVWSVTEVRRTELGYECDRPGDGGHRRETYILPASGMAIILGRPSTKRLRTDAPTLPTVQEVTLPESARPGPSIATVAAQVAGGRSLTAARIVLAVGRGIGGPEHVPLFRDLADRLGAALGATRAVVDAGWLSFAHQIGQTGAWVAPEMYLGFGVSGAMQHLAGLGGARMIIAVNTDPEAPLCRLADVVVLADAVTVAERLVEQLGAVVPLPRIRQETM